MKHPQPQLPLPPSPRQKQQRAPHFIPDYPQSAHHHPHHAAYPPIVLLNIAQEHAHRHDHHHHQDPAREFVTEPLLETGGAYSYRHHHHYEGGGGHHYYYGGGLPAMFLIAFAIYALIVSNTGEINAKCGDSLWKFVISSLFINFFQVFTVCIGMSIAFCMAASLGSSSSAGWFAPAVGLFLVACALGALVGVGFTITTAAFDKPLCQTALSAASFTGTPLLAIIGTVYVVIDCILLALVVLGGICVFCVFGSDGFMGAMPTPAAS